MASVVAASNAGPIGRAKRTHLVTAGLVPAIHVFAPDRLQDVDARDVGERSDAVLRTAMRGHDESRFV